MAEIELSQTEADALIAVPKSRVSDEEYLYPGGGGALRVPLHSKVNREDFYLDISRGRINLAKGTYQSRGRLVVVLVRLDFGGGIHRNPDGEDIPCPHLHVYREGYGDKWAVPMPPEHFTDTGDLWLTLEEFMRYCKVVEPPNISGKLLV